MRMGVLSYHQVYSLFETGHALHMHVHNFMQHIFFCTTFLIKLTMGLAYHMYNDVIQYILVSKMIMWPQKI